VADKPKSFSDYYSATGGTGGPYTTPSVPSAGLPQLSNFGGASTKSNEPQDALSWLTDIISRPLFGVTNMVSASFNQAAKGPAIREKFDSGDVLGGIGDVLGGAVDQLAAPIRGVFSTDTKDKHYTSDLIEQGTDTAGALIDPDNYVDVQDNVNPLLKGVAGFVGDVGADPLTYVPGGMILSAGKKLVKGGKLLTEGVRAGAETIVQGAKAGQKAESVVDDLLKETAKIKAPTKASATEAAALRVEKDAADTFAADYAKQLDTMDDATFEAMVAQRTADVAKRDIRRQVLTNPKAQSLKGALEGLTPMTLKTAVRSVADPMAAKPLTFGPNPELASGVVGSAGWVAEVTEAVQRLEKLSDAPALTIAGKRTPLPVVLLEAEKGNAGALRVLQQFHQSVYLPAFAKAKQQGKLIDALGRVVTPKKPKAEVMETVLNSLGNFKRQVAENEGALVQSMGKPLVEALRKMTNPNNFDNVVSEMRGILDQSLDVSALSRLSSPTEKMLREIGMDPAAVPLSVRKWQGVPNMEAPANNIAELVAKMGDDATDPIVKMAESGIRRGIDANIVTPKMPERYPFQSKSGALRTDELYGDGWGRYMREANTYFQWNVIKDMFSPARELAKAQGVTYARASAEAVRTNVKQALRLAERWYDENGVPLTVGVGPDRVPLGMSQVLDVLDDLDRKGMQAYFWNYSTAVPPTNLLDAVFAAIKGGDRTQIEAMLRQAETRHLSSEGKLKPMENNLVKPITNKLGGTIGREKIDGEMLVRGLTDLIEKATPVLRHVVENNAQSLGARRVAETYEMTDNQLKHLEDVFANRQGYGSILEELADTSTRVQKLATERGTTQTATNMAGTATEALIPAADKLIATAAVKASKAAISTAKTSKSKNPMMVLDDVQRAGVEADQRLFDDLNVETFTEAADQTMDFGERIQQLIGTGALAKLAPVFSRTAGNVAIHRDLVRSENWFRDIVATSTDKLNVLSAKHTQEELALAFQSIQKGVLSPDPVVAGAAADLADIAGQIFGGTGRSALIDNSFFRSNASIHHANAVIEFYFKNGDYLFDADKAAEAAKLSGRTVMEEAAEQWRTWDIKDPADFLNRMYTGLAKVNADQSIAQAFQKLTTDMRLSSKVPKPGYSRITDEGGKSILAKYMPANVYYEDGILRQLAIVDSLMRDTLKLDGTLGKVVKEVYKPALDMWKYGMTLPNPTHHVRNLISDMSLTFLTLGTKGSKDMYLKAMHAMGTRNGYTNWDAISAIQGAGAKPVGAGAMAIEGRHGKLTYDQLYSEFASRGNLPRFRTLENFEQDGQGTGKLTSVWDTITHTKAAQVIGGVSEARDHYVRLAHGIQFLTQHISDPKYKNMEHLLTAASDSVRKWHPDGSDLTKSEQAFRLIIPFYSWQRKAIPLILESVLTQPARVMAFPKASFNLAVAMGVNPDSLSNPFPEDQMFPSYMTNKLTGPQFEIDGKYYAINPGIASVDVLNEYLGDEAFRSVLGSVSPFIRAPFELAAGGQVGTGARINDTSDYIDSQIPGVGHASRLTGNSVTGSLVSLLQGQGLDPQFQIAQGNKDPVGGPAMAFTNWLTGLGIQNMSQQNQINYAEIEKRNREGEAAGF